MKTFSDYIKAGEEIKWTGGPTKMYGLFDNKDDLKKSLFIYSICLLFSVIFGYFSIHIYRDISLLKTNQIPSEYYIALVVLIFLAVFVLTVPPIYFLLKNHIRKKHYYGLKYSLTNKAAYIHVNRAANNLIRIDYMTIIKIYCVKYPKIEEGEIHFVTNNEFVNNGVFSFDFENTFSPKFSFVSDVQVVFDMLSSLTRYDVLIAKRKENDTLELL